jgi:HSP20 family protein
MFRKKDTNIIPREIGGNIMMRESLSLWNEFDRLFKEFRRSVDELLRPFNVGIESADSTRVPAMDIADVGDKYEVKVELPGIPKEDIDIKVTPYSLEISAEHSESKDEEGKNWIRRELSSRRYYRSIELPEELKTDDVEAELKEGILTITLPKLEPKPEYKAKKVKIK